MVQFDGLSQLYSSFDFSSVLSEYSVLAIARHTGGQNGAVISSVGSDWIFGLGDNYNAYWKLGPASEFSATSANAEWNLYAGTFASSGALSLKLNGYEMISENTAPSVHSKPRLLALGGAHANHDFSKSEVAEVLVFDRKISEEESSNLSSYLRNKWIGGTLENFKLLVRMSSTLHPDFDLSTFADLSDGGDLRFYDEYNRGTAI